MNTLDELVDCIRQAAQGPSPETEVGRLVEELIRTPEVLAEVLSAASPGAGVVSRAPDLTVLHAVVPAGVVSPPHDHRMWAVIGVLEGTEHNAFYRRSTDGSLEPTAEGSVGAGEVAVLDAHTIHHIANDGPGTLRALHVYGGDLLGIERSQWNAATGEEEPFAIALTDRS